MTAGEKTLSSYISGQRVKVLDAFCDIPAFFLNLNLPPAPLETQRTHGPRLRSRIDYNPMNLRL